MTCVVKVCFSHIDGCISATMYIGTGIIGVIWKKKRKKTVRFGIGSTKSIGRCSAHMAPLKNSGNESGVAGRQGPPGN